jgi:AmmeMemoRadiSam system protein A
METYSDNSKKYLLGLARRAIHSQFKKVNKTFQTIPSEVEKERGVFVTLSQGDKLRGCIGNITPEGPIYSAVARNAVLAAFDDTRFPVLEEKELSYTNIEISILSDPKQIEFKNSDELIDKLSSKPGVVLQKGWKKATFLPQVWDKLTTPKEFLSQLCRKGRIQSDAWMQKNKDQKDEEPLEIYTYNVIKFSEADY